MVAMRGRRRKQLLYELKATKGCWKLREEACKSHSLEKYKMTVVWVELVARRRRRRKQLR